MGMLDRAILAQALRPAGLVNYPTEWWHWSYGDRYWALVTGAPYATYGSATDRRG
jgi:D-alanyl-D-alanine dipeptidase